jgi:hypothetical protein
MTSTGPHAVALAILDLARAGQFADINDWLTGNARSA